jgi:hypothetical protein
MKRALLGIVLLIGSMVAANAQTPTTYSIANGLNTTLTYRAFNCAGILCTSSIPIDFNGNVLTGLAGSPTTQAMTVQGIGASGTPLLVSPSNIANTVPWLTTIQQGGNAAVVNASGQLSINCANCTGSGVSQQDSTTFTQTTSNMVPIGGIFISSNSISNLASGQAGVAQLTTDRMLYVNIGKVGGTAVVTGVGAVGTGSLRIAVGQDTSTIAGSAPGTAGSASANVLSIQGITSMVPVQVSQATPANLNATVVGTGTFQMQAQQSGNWTARVVGNTGAAMDTAAGQTAPANGLQIGGVYNVSAPTPSTGQFEPLQLDASGRLVVNCGTGCSSSGGSSLADEGTFTQGTTSLTVTGGIYTTSPANLLSGQGGAMRLTVDRLLYAANAMSLTTLSPWNTSTGSNTTQSIMATRGAPIIIVQLDQTTTITGGAVTWEGTYDGTNWVSLNSAQVVDPTSTTFAQIANPYSFQASTNKPFMLFPAGMQQLRMRLSTTITGSGAVTPFVAQVDADVANAIWQSAQFSQISAGVSIPGAAPSATAIYVAGDALNAEPTALTNATTSPFYTDLVGKMVTSPYANRELMWRGGGTSTTTSPITIKAAAGSGVKNYLTDISCTRNDTATTAITVTLNDSSAMQFDLPDNGGGGGFTHTFNVPLATAANASLTATASAGVTTLKCWGTGFTGY